MRLQRRLSSRLATSAPCSIPGSQPPASSPLHKLAPPPPAVSTCDTERNLAAPCCWASCLGLAPRQVSFHLGLAGGGRRRQPPRRVLAPHLGRPTWFQARTYAAEADAAEEGAGEEGAGEREGGDGEGRGGGGGGGGRRGGRHQLTPLERNMLWLWSERLRGMGNLDYQLKHDERLMLAQETKERMFELHCSDPRHWDVSRLSREFGLSKARVTGLLMFQQMRAEAVAHGQEINDSITRDMEETFGVVDRYADKIILPLDRDDTHSSSNVPIEEDADEEAYYEVARKIRQDGRLKFIPKQQMPKEPPPEEEHQLKAKILYEPTNKVKDARGWILEDADDDKAYLGRKVKIDDAKRLTWVLEPEGVIRTPTWSERRAMQRPNIHKRPDEKWEYSILDRVDAKDLERYHRLVVNTPNLYLSADEMMALGMPEPPEDIKEQLEAREHEAKLKASQHRIAAAEEKAKKAEEEAALLAQQQAGGDAAGAAQDAGAEQKQQ